MDMRETFRRAVCRILEQFAFMFAETDDERQVADYPGEFFHAVITFSGSRQGAVALSAPVALCREMAGNVLGEEPAGGDEAIAQDALKELLNVICGELTAALFGNREAFDLTVPSLYAIDRGKWRELAADRDNIRLWVEDKPLLAGLLLLCERAG